MAKMLTLTTLAADPDHFHLIDVRDADDYAAAHVTGAVHIPLSGLEARVDEIPAGKTPVTICGKGGGRSDRAAELLRAQGFASARPLCGGTLAWQAQHTPAGAPT